MYLLKDKYKCFKFFEKGTTPPRGYQYIKLLWTFDVKFDGRKRARLVAGGHMTEKLDKEETTSTMVGLDTVILASLAARCKGLKCLSGDINSAYIQAHTKEKVYTIAGPEFGPLEGQLVIIDKALYGLQTSGNAWHSKLSDDLRDMGFTPSKADRDLWIRERGDYLEYMCVFVDDITVFSKEPMLIFDTLKEKYGYEFKEIAEPEYYNGADLSVDRSGEMTMSAKTYLKNIVDKIEDIIGQPLKNYGAPMVTTYHPEIDESDLLDPNFIKIYQMLIGCAQWAVTIGRYDIQYATNTLARYASCPREGHLKAIIRVFGYLKHHKKYRIKIDPDPPNYNGLTFTDHDWTEIYDAAVEELPLDAPPAYVDEVYITVYVDASHACDLVTRRSVTGILLCVNKTPIKWYSKRQNTVETSTYGSELVALRIAVEMVMEYRYILRMMGFTITKPSTVLMDNESVVKNTTLPSSVLKKKHNAIAYHRVREAVAAGIVRIAYIPSKENRADILTKPLNPQDYYYLLSGILFECSNSGNQGELQLDLSKSGID